MEPQPPSSAGTARKRSRLAPQSIRGRLLAGTLVIIPITVTLWLLNLVYGVALAVGKPLVGWVRHGLNVAFGWELTANPGPAENIVAVFLTLAVLYFLGWLASNVVGQRLIRRVESFVERIPLVDTIYSSCKRMLQSLSGPPGVGEGASSVVLIDFPTPPLKVLAFMTNTITDTTTGQQFAAVFVPTTPNPTSGYMELVPLERVHATNWTSEEALASILSGGALCPKHIQVRPIEPKASG